MKYFLVCKINYTLYVKEFASRDQLLDFIKEKSDVSNTDMFEVITIWGEK